MTDEEKRVLVEITKDIFKITFGQYNLDHMGTFVELNYKEKLNKIRKDSKNEN